MYGCESFHHKEGRALKNWCFWTVVLEKTLESPLNSKDIKQVNPKGNQSCIFIGRTDAEAETLILCPPDAKNRLIRKDPDAGKDWRQKKGTTEDEMVGWHHWLDGHEFEQAPGVGDAQGSLACCSLWSRTDLDMTERLNNNDRNAGVGIHPHGQRGLVGYSPCGHKDSETSEATDTSKQKENNELFNK